MNPQLSAYIQQVILAVNFEDGAKLKWCLSISPGQEEGLRRANFPEPSDFDLYQLPEKFRNVVKSHLKLMKSVYLLKNIDVAFDELDEMVNNLNRAADSQTNWINLPLINACTELITVYKVKSQSNPENELIEFQDVEVENSRPSSLEKLANTVNKSFKLSLNDKNLDLRLSKRSDIYFFLGCLIKIYFKLGKLELAKSVEKALKGTRFKLPELNGSLATKKYAVTYLYYSAFLSLDDADFITSEDKLMKALEISSYYNEPKNKQTEKILLILLPLRLYNKRLTPNKKVWEDYPSLKMVYKDNLFSAIYTGNLAKFTETLEKFEVFFLKNYLYLLVEHLKVLCYLKLIKKTALFIDSLNPDSKTNHIIPLNAFQVALEFSTFKSDSKDNKKNGNGKSNLSGHSFQYSLDEVECILANLISNGKIKGYLSHSNKCIVLSKQNAFPNQVSKPT